MICALWRARIPVCRPHVTNIVLVLHQDDTMSLHALAELKANQSKKTCKLRIWQRIVLIPPACFDSFKCGDAVCNEKDIECGWELLQVLERMVLRNQFGNALILFRIGCWE